MTLHRKQKQNSHYAISPALRRDTSPCTRRLSGHSVSTTRHSANGIASCVGPQLDHARGATKVDHRTLLCRDETSWREGQSARRSCTAGFDVESIVFQGSVASWCVSRNGGLCRSPVPAAGTTGPKTAQKKFALWIGTFRFATSRGSRYRVGPNGSSSNVPVAVARLPNAGCPERAVPPAMPSASWSQTSWSGSDRAPRCARAFPVRSTVLLRCVGGVSCPLPNRARCRRCGLGERFEQVFEEICKPNDCRNSAVSASRSGPTKRQTSSWPSASAARSVLRNSTSPAIVSPLTKLSWSCSTNSGPASGPWVEGEPGECDGSAWDRLPPLVRSIESQAKATRGKPGMAGAEGAVRQNNRREGLRVGEPTRIGRLSWPALGRTSNVSELGVTAGETALNTRCGPLALDRATKRSPMGMSDCRGDHNSRGYAAGNAAQLGCEGNRLSRRSNRDEGLWTAGGVTGGESAATDFMQGRAARSAHVAHNHKVVSSNLTPATSSGGGLGIHQPGSMTRGGDLLATAPSGRARLRAMCPAVARSFAGRAA